MLVRPKLSSAVQSTMSTLQFEAAPLPAHAQPSSEAPRKKRKRAPARGATDDCFTCLSHKIQCDRGRPYCSPCLNSGQDCAGYKTQLTWGVGVASRGKLRGLSLPVAGVTKPANDSEVSSPKAKKPSNVKQGTRSNAQTRSPNTSKPEGDQDNQKGTAVFDISTRQTNPPHKHAFYDLPPQQPLATRTPPVQNISYGGQPNVYPSPTGPYNTTRIPAPASTDYTQGSILSPSSESSSHVRQAPYPSPSPTARYFQICPTQPQMPLTPTSQTYSLSLESSALSQTAYYPTQQTTYHMQHEYVDQTMYIANNSFPELVQSNLIRATSEDDVEEIDRSLENDGGFSGAKLSSLSTLAMDSLLTFPLSGFSGVGKTPRMQYLIQYYAEVISPVIVAFDSPSNPLRNQILNLAAHSESLQHAIAALSASNIRQRKESGALSTCKTPGARRSSYMHLSLTNNAWDDSDQQLTIQDRKTEESLHKYAAIRMLNQHLAHPIKRKDDSVLATLLMLCLFHICDSGIARFQTQFAGVQKLLALRGNGSSGPNGDTKWMTRIFTLFDSVAATVNDRESQIGGQYINLCSQPGGEWPYETLSGIDSRLCLPMSRLGRLNVLSQGQSVDSLPQLVSKPLPAMHSVTTTNYLPNEFRTFDDKGWTRIVSDENLFNLKTATPTVQEIFWREWREVRQDLLTWTYDDSRFDGSDPSRPYLTAEQRFDMRNISESFRYSSLLYTERLADPKIPSSHPNIQDWVQKSLYHIKLVRADVYLLWPLFITGAECGEEQERNVIRERCLDIQKDSGFMNNSSCLTLLEKVWKGDGVSASDGTNRPSNMKREPGTFRFRDVMLAEGNDGEWIVV